jgi:hypothetical protein
VYSYSFGITDDRPLAVNLLLAKAQIKCKEYRAALKNLEYILIQHEFRYQKSTPHVDIYHDQKMIGYCCSKLRQY